MTSSKPFNRLLLLRRRPFNGASTLIHVPARPTPTRYLARTHTRAPTRTYATHIRTENLPRVVQPSLWTNIIPRFLRPSPSASASSQGGRLAALRAWLRKEWNPATAFVVLGLVVGSNAINTLVLRKDTADFSRKADAKIALLKEVVERVQRGEEVDVEGVLGTGRREVEGEWEEVLKEIEAEDRTWQSRKRRKAAAAAAKEAAQSAEVKAVAAETDTSAAEPDVVPDHKRGAIGFY